MSISTIARPFFLTAPLALLGAGLLLTIEGDVAFRSSWDPVTLALAHLGTLGFLALVMLGLAYQVIASLTKSPPSSRLAYAVNALLVLGIISLVWSLRANASFVSDSGPTEGSTSTARPEADGSVVDLKAHLEQVRGHAVPQVRAHKVRHEADARGHVPVQSQSDVVQVSTADVPVVQIEVREARRDLPGPPGSALPAEARPEAHSAERRSASALDRSWPSSRTAHT